MRNYLSLLLPIVCWAAWLPAQSIDSLVASYAGSVPKVIATERPGAFSTGSGVYLGQSWVLSAKHVTGGAESIRCVFPNRPPIDVADYVYSKNSDQVLLRLAADPGVPAVRLVEQTTATVLYGAGYDHGRTLRFWSGQPTSATYNSGLVRTFVGEGGARQGNSGGPVFCSTGCVGNLWGTNGGACFYTSNRATLGFIRRAAVRYPDLNRIIPGGAISSQEACPSCPVPEPVPEPQPIQQQQVPQPQTTTPGKVPSDIRATIIPRIIPTIEAINSEFSVPVDIPVTIRLQIQPQMSMGQTIR